MNNVNNPAVRKHACEHIYFLEFVERLPLTEEQKIEFVTEHILSAKKAQEQKEKNKMHFSLLVLGELLTRDNWGDPVVS